MSTPPVAITGIGLVSALGLDAVIACAAARAGLNRLRVVAHNEGRVPPNTASCILRRGKGREALLIKTARDKDQVIVFRMK